MTFETSRRGFLASMGAFAAALTMPVPMSMEQAEKLLPPPILPDPPRRIGFMAVRLEMTMAPGVRARLDFQEILGWSETRAQKFLLGDQEDLTIKRVLDYFPTFQGPMIVSPRPATVILYTSIKKALAVNFDEIVDFQFDVDRPVPFSVSFS